MSKHVFGKTIERTFYPMKRSEAIELPTQTLEIHRYDTKPSYDDATDGTGAVAAGTQTSQKGNPNFEFTYNLPAIDDPEPGSNTSARTYWESIKYIAEEDGEPHVIIRSFVVERLEDLPSLPGTTVHDIQKIWPYIDSYLDSTEVNDQIAMAEIALKAELRAKGIRWERMFNLDDYKVAIAYKAIAESAFGQIQTPQDRHFMRYEKFKADYITVLSTLIALHDPHGDGEPTAASRTVTDGVVVRR